MWKVSFKEPTKKFIEVNLPESKSIANRLLILNKVLALLGKPTVMLNNVSNADDTKLMLYALSNDLKEVNLKNAGTCLRFLTALYAAHPSFKISVDGNSRLLERPIAPLIQSLQNLGANISDTKLPYHITGKELSGGEIFLDASHSSQFISALIMIAPLMKAPLTIKCSKNIASKSYIKLTQQIIEELGGKVKVEPNTITVENYLNNTATIYNIEKDWSSAAFWYQLVALNKTIEVKLKGLKLKSKQGDSELAAIMNEFGVATQEQNDGVVIKHVRVETKKNINLNLENCPDIAPSVICTSAILKQVAKFTGLQTLPLKECNRLEALALALTQLGYDVSYDKSSLTLGSNRSKISQPQVLKTFNDHRMAMAFAPLAVVEPNILLDHAMVTEKSYPEFWQEMQKAGINLTLVY